MKVIKQNDSTLLIKRLKSLADVELDIGKDKHGFPIALIIFDVFEIEVSYSYSIKTTDVSFTHLFGVEKDIDKWIEVEIHKCKMNEHYEEYANGVPSAIHTLFKNKHNRVEAKKEVNEIVTMKLEEKYF